MKNITVSVNDEVYHRARLRAAELRTSISALVSRFLEKTALEESNVDRLKRLERETVSRIHARQKGFSAKNRLKRDDLYDRHALR